MQAALDGGINPQRIDVNCNAKTDELIRTAIDKNMMLVANDVTEYLLISEIALAMKKSPKVMLRISGLKSGKSLDYHVTTAGYWTKFGCPLDEVPGFFAIMKSHQHLDFQGFHVHIGSQVTEAAPFLFALGKLIGISRECNSRGRRCEAINIGGGYPVSYLTREQWGNILNMALAGHKRSVEGDNSGLWIWGGGASGFQYRGKGRNKTVRYAGKQYFCEHAKEDMLREILKGSVNVDGKSIGTVNALKEIGEPMLVIEPGRSIVEDSGITLVGVVSTRKMYGIHNLVTVNAGEVNFAAAMSGMPMNVWENATYLKIRDINPFEAFVAGQLCFSSDMLAKVKIELQHEPKKGEILMIRDTGAYDSQFFTANTNSFPRPARLIAMENGSVECLKKRDTYEDIFSI
jgi:diaminopimelate decarboxylase